MAARSLILLSLALLFVTTHSRKREGILSPSPSPSPAPSSPPSPSPSRSLSPPFSFPSQPPTYVCDPKRFANLGLDVSAFAFCDKHLPYDIRVKDLIDRMTLSEKVQQLGNKAYGVPRIGLPEYEWWSEALHGVSDVGPGTRFDNTTLSSATSFPTVILTSASFNESLWKAIGQAVSTEARAMYNLGLAGLTFWSPNINVVRDPRWGRITETPGEDPFVVGRYAVNYVRGLQDVEGYETSDDLNFRPLKVAACCKHYAAYDVDDWLGVDRYHFNARVTEQDMVETFLRPFEMCVKEGDVSSVMCSYNRVNGIPTCADPRLLSQTIRGEWNLHGYIVSDCDSIEVIVNGHKWLGDTEEDAVAQVLRAGLDLDCGTYYTNFTEAAVENGKAREGDVDKALKNLYLVLMRLGFFDGIPTFHSLGKKDICSTAHIKLASDAAKQGIVLLKNNNTLLPLSSDKYKKLAAVGPHANATKVMIGNYALQKGTPCRYVSPKDGLSKFATVDFEMGCSDVACSNETYIYPAVVAAKKADATIIFVGTDLTIEGEGLDRSDLLLPGYQTQLIEEIVEAVTTPIVLVILSAGGVDISFAKNNSKIDAIIWAGFPGAEGGAAIADIVFGKHNPGGRLPMTWYNADYVDMLPMTSMQLRPLDDLGYPGRTYKFFNGSTVYPFGYGLSYTHFNYTMKTINRPPPVKLRENQHCRQINYKSDAFIPPCQAVLVEDLSCDDLIHFEMEVSNTGKVDGSHVVFVYSIPPEGLVGAPFKQLVAFQRVFVRANEKETLHFTLNTCKSLGLVDETAYSIVPAGEHIIMVGDGDGAISFPVHINFDL